mgnify:CR=1 FL=1
MTQTELARLINANQSTINRYENGKMAITLEVLEKIAFALGVTSASILGWKEGFTEQEIYRLDRKFPNEFEDFLEMLKMKEKRESKS